MQPNVQNIAICVVFIGFGAPMCVFLESGGHFEQCAPNARGDWKSGGGRRWRPLACGAVFFSQN